MQSLEILNKKIDTLSKSQKKVAKYVVDNFEKSVFLTAKELSEKVSVSEVTVIRLSHELGYSGFAEMKKDMRELLSDINSLNFSDHIDELKDNIKNKEIIDFVKQQSIQLSKIYNNINYKQLADICNIIMNKKRVLIIGFVNSFGVAAEMLRLLDNVRKRVYFSKLAYENAYALEDIDQDSATIVISFAPHYKHSFVQAKTTKKNGSKLIVLTDSIVNPYKDIADYTIAFNINNSDNGIIDTSPVHAFIHFIINYICKNYQHQIEIHKKNLYDLEDFIE